MCELVCRYHTSKKRILRKKCINRSDKFLNHQNLKFIVNFISPTFSINSSFNKRFSVQLYHNRTRFMRYIKSSKQKARKLSAIGITLIKTSRALKENKTFTMIFFNILLLLIFSVVDIGLVVRHLAITPEKCIEVL